MKKSLSPTSLLLYLLTIPSFVLIGFIYATLTGAAEGQGLAGGAIVLGYGVMFAIVGLVLSFILTLYFKQKAIARANRILAILLCIVTVIIVYRLNTMERKDVPVKEYPKNMTTPAGIQSPIVSRIAENFTDNVSEIPLGLGFFKPDFYKNTVLYFYGNPNMGKSVIEHFPTDSIVFNRIEHGRFDITYAPPWLVPEHLKLDYEILYFKILSIGRDLIKIVVNKHNQRIIYVSRNAGEIIYWPDFLLSMNSVDFLKEKNQAIRYKASHQAGEVLVKFQFMKPILVENDWMNVRLVDDNYKIVSTGWIQWKKDGELLITYSLFS